ncbi:MAG: large conductance mechanosensitive channel protein MscL [Betaproteobacteria bacterium]|jgi:large conductance mechanosensitive channel|nr:large conductance mechanosensitive channel protein MscL [Betaproteobacteria bacterium]
MSFASEFKQFALKGNVVDLAVGVIIGAAFGKIVDSVVNDLVMPVVGRAMGNADFSNLFLALKDVPAGVPMTLDAVRKAGVPVLAWGNFATIALNFAILAFIIFIMVRQINRLKSEAPAAPPPATPEDVQLLREIRDSLRK